MCEVASYFPRALWYKEWHRNRLKALIMFCIFALAPVGSVLLLLTQTGSAGNALAAVIIRHQFWTSFNNYLSVSSAFQGSRDGLLGVIAVMVLAAILVSSERRGKTLLTAMAMPVRRDDWLRTKFLFGLAIIIGSLTFLFIWQAVVNLFNPQPLSVWVLMRWWLWTTTFDGAVFAVTFFVGVCVTGSIWTLIGTMGILGLPLWLDSVIVVGTTGAPLSPPQWVYSMANYIGSMSPMWGFGATHFVLLHVLWDLLLIPLGYWAAQAIFLRTRAENFEQLFTSHCMWHWFHSFISVMIGSYIAMVVRGSLEYVNARPKVEISGFWIAFALASAAVWLILFGIHRVVSRNR